MHRAAQARNRRGRIHAQQRWPLSLPSATSTVGWISSIWRCR
jgi:hypothetical protein